MLIGNLSECVASVPMGRTAAICRDGRDQATRAVPDTVTTSFREEGPGDCRTHGVDFFWKEINLEKPAKKGKR
jgi:hypothetical protein